MTVSSYIRFEAEGGPITIEASAEEVSPAPGVVKAGVKEKVQDALVVAQEGFEEAMKRILSYNARIITEAVVVLPHPPDQLEVRFGLKATGEVGNFAVTKLGGEANYQVTLTWNDLKGGTAGRDGG